MNGEVLFSDEHEDFSAIVIRLPNGSIFSRCKRRRPHGDVVQELPHNSPKEAQKHISWWVRRP